MSGYSLTPPSIWLDLSTALCLLLAIASVRRKRSDFSRYFALATVASAVYSFGYALELGARDYAAMRLALRIEYLSIPFLSSLWLLMAYAYVHQRPLGKPLLLLLFALPALTFILAQTTEYHHLFYRDLRYSQTDGLTIAVISRGPWYYVHHLYTNLGFLLYNAILLRSCRHAQPLYRNQALLLAAGSFAPWACMLLFLFRLSPDNIDLNPFGMTLIGVAGGIAVWRYEFLNLVPAARDVVFNSIDEGVLIVDPRQHLVDFNPAARSIFPQLNRESIGTPIGDMLAVPALLAAGTSPVQFEYGEPARIYEAQRYPLKSNRSIEQGQVILVRDITERQALEHELVRLATRDELTGLHNRRYLMEHAETAVQMALRHQRPLAVLIGDLDFFKEVNDQYGHLAGDRLLQQVAACLHQRLRQTDIVGRYGGDEFVIVLPETAAEDAERIARDIAASVSSETGYGMSIGLAVLHSQMSQFRDVLAEADAALYRIKAARTTSPAAA